MKSVYVESSVISYMTARPSRDVVTSARQTVTIEWWDAYKDTFEIFVSELVIKEIGSGNAAAAQKRLLFVENIPVLETTKNAVELAKLLVEERAVPDSCIEDALHISIAAVQRINFLLTWNFKHINNANTREKISKVIMQAQLKSPILCSPEELINER